MSELRVPAIIFSRVVGYFSVVSIGDVSHWNPGKTEEFKERKTYDLNKSLTNNMD